MAEEKNNGRFGLRNLTARRTSLINSWKFMSKYLVSLLFLWSSAGLCNWFPELTVLRMDKTTVTFNGALSGVGYSQDPVNPGCEYVNYLKNGQPLPDIYYQNEATYTCMVSLYSRMVIREDLQGQAVWQGIGNCCAVSFKLTYKQLYENNVLTMGDFIRVAYASGLIKDQISGRTWNAVFGNPNNQCFYWGLSRGFTNTFVELSNDAACYRGQIVHPSCDINNTIIIDHGLVSQDVIKSGGASASVNAFLTCDYAADVILRTNVASDLKLETSTGRGGMTSKIFVNGHSLLVSGGLKIHAPSGNTPLKITSVLSGSGNPEGEFRGSTVLVISMP